jgi:hypothetical protein
LLRRRELLEHSEKKKAEGPLLNKFEFNKKKIFKKERVRERALCAHVLGAK